jgi:hypothetical protein
VPIDLFTRHGIDLAVLDPVPGFSIDLMESYLLALRSRWKELNGAGHQR